MFVFYNPNPDGIYTDDCTVRAASKMLDQTWEKAYMDICFEGLKLHKMPSSQSVWNSYLASLGFKRYSIPNICPACYSVKQFCVDFNVGRYLVATDDHVIAVIDGNYYDTADTGDEIPIYYWKET